MSTRNLRYGGFPWGFVLGAYAGSWAIWIAGWYLVGQPRQIDAPGGMMMVVLAGSFVPGLAAAITTAFEGGGALKAWFRAFIHVRCGWRAYAAALVPFPAALLLLTAVFGYTPIPAASGGMTPALFYLTIFPVSILNGLATAIVGAGPVGEEGGWRGYLLPRLIVKHGELRSSLVVGMVWALWHLPIMAIFPDWRDGIPFWTYLPIYVGGVMALSLLMTRVWRIGGGSLVPVIWLHGIVNAAGSIAFNRKLWESGWSAEFGAVLFGVAAFAAAAVLYAVKPPVRR